MRPAMSVVVCASVLSLSNLAFAQDFQVNLFDDEYDGVCDAHCSLRDAVSASNKLGNVTSRIVLPAGHYSLSRRPESEPGEVYDEDANLDGDLDVLAGNLTLVGAGRGTTIIEGGGIDRLFEVAARAVLQINDLTLRNGVSMTDGAGIENRGQVIVRRSLFQGNRIRNEWGGRNRGGAIYSEGTLAVYDSIFESNSIFVGEMGMANGGALYSAGTLEVRDTLFRGNSATTDDVTGGGGTLYNIGQASVARVAIIGSASDGPGLAIRNDDQGELTLSNATVAHSRSWDYETEAAVFNNNHARMKLLHVTIAENPTAGLINNGVLEVRNSLIVANDYGNCENNGTISQSEGVLLGLDSSNCAAAIYLDNHAVNGKVLHVLKERGAGLPSFGLPPQSPALDAGVGLCPQVDQRGYPRPADGDGDGVAGCDIGAFERAARR